MEILIFALIASYNTPRRREQVVSEPEEFQPFDLQALRNSAPTRCVNSPNVQDFVSCSLTISRFITSTSSVDCDFRRELAQNVMQSLHKTTQNSPR
jgi:hypothetical protein